MSLIIGCSGKYIKYYGFGAKPSMKPPGAVCLIRGFEIPLLAMPLGECNQWRIQAGRGGGPPY